MSYCPHCGAEAAEGTRFCSSCGKLLPQASPSPDAPFTPPAQQFPAAGSYSMPTVPPMPPAPPRRSGLWLALVAALVVVGAAVTAYLLLFNRTPKQLFLESQVRLLSGMAADLQESMGPGLALQERMQKEPYQSTVKMTADFDLSPQDPSILMVKEILKRSSLVVGTSRDPASDRQLVDFALNVRGTDLVTGEFYQSPDELALKVPVLHSKYLQVKNQNLQETFGALGVPWTGPDRILTTQDYPEYLDIDPIRWAPLLKDYAGWVKDFIQDEEVSLEKEYRYPSPDGAVTMKRVTLTLSEQRVKEFYIGLGRKLRDDERALDLVAANVSGWADLMIDSGQLSAYDLEELGDLQDTEYVKQQIRDGIADWEQTWNEAKLPNGLKIATVLDSKNNVVEEEILLTVVDYTEPVDLKVTVTRWNGKDETRDRNLVVSAKARGESGRFEWKSHTVPISKTESRTTTTILATDSATGMDYGLDGEIIATVVKGAQEGKDRRTYDFRFDLGEAEPTLKGQVSILHTAQGTAKRFESLTEVVVDVDPNSGWDPQVKLTFTLDSATDLGGNLEFPSFTSANALNLNTMSPSEWDRLMVEIESAAERFVMRNLNLFMN